MCFWDTFKNKLHNSWSTYQSRWSNSGPSGQSRTLLHTWFCCKLPKKVSYICTFDAPDKGQLLDMWESQTTESALRWWAPDCSTSYSWSCSWSYSWSYSWTHVLGIKTMTSLILDHIAMDYLYLGTNTERRDKIMIVLELSKDRSRPNSTLRNSHFVDHF